MPANKPDHYAVLGVFRDASQEEIKRAYFDAAQRLHPDKNVAAGETELFLEIQQSYEILSNPKRRNLYDATLPLRSQIFIRLALRCIMPLHGVTRVLSRPFLLQNAHYAVSIPIFQQNSKRLLILPYNITRQTVFPAPQR